MVGSQQALLVLIAIGLGAGQCRSSGAAPQSDWRVRELGHSWQGGSDTPQTVVIRDSATFHAAWLRLFPPATRPPEMPQIDFRIERVFLVASGTRPTGGFRVALSDAAALRDSAIIGVTLFTPAAGCAVTEALTSPAVVLAVPVAPVPFRVTSHERPDTVRCN